MTLALPIVAAGRTAVAANGVSPDAVRDYGDLAALPPAYGALFAAAERENVCLSRDWFDLLARHEADAPGRLRLLGHQAGGGAAPAALLIGRHRERDPMAFGGRSFTSLDNFYTLLYAPLLGPAASAERAGAALNPLAAHLCGKRPAYDAIRLQALDSDTPAFAALGDAFAAQGFAVQTYRHFANWTEPVAGRSYADYLAARPGRLRSTIARKTRRLARRGPLDLMIAQSPAELADAWPRYETVYAKGWKRREVRPALMHDFARLLAARGALRLGVLSLGDAPIAAQLWIVWGGAATVYKLAHDQAHDDASPGTVLTARMIAHLIGRESKAVRELDFGPGDDAWKRAWASRDRARWGLLALNQRSAAGRLAIARHIWGRQVKRAVVGHTARF